MIVFTLFFKVFTINGNVPCYETRFACQFMSKRFSVIKVGFHNSEVKKTNFSFCNHGREATFLKFCPLKKLIKGTAKV